MLLELCNLPYIKSMLLLFSSFAPSPLHWWKVKKFMKVAKVGEDECFNLWLWTMFLYLIMEFHCSLCFIDSFVLHLISLRCLLLEGTFVKKQGWGELFLLAYFHNCCVCSSFPIHIKKNLLLKSLTLEEKGSIYNYNFVTINKLQSTFTTQNPLVCISEITSNV
jgi:hypothetical protein